MVRYFQGDLKRARSGFEEVLWRWRELGDLWAVGQAHQAHAWCISAQGEMTAARVLLERAMPLSSSRWSMLGVFATWKPARVNIKWGVPSYGESVAPTPLAPFGAEPRTHHNCAA